MDIKYGDGFLEHVSLKCAAVQRENHARNKVLDLVHVCVKHDAI